MKSPTQITLLMGIVAAVVSAVAAFFYPWPEPVVENDMVDKPLFEEFDASSVRSISITKFDTDRNQLDRMDLRRSGERWLIPAKKNFLATQASQISRVINALSSCTVLENRSNNQQDHIEYGVVDPIEYESAANRSSLGTKIILEDRNKRELASLIVGSTVRTDSRQQAPKNFVRIPGQPNVYVVEFDPGATTTEFTDWVSPNLLQLSENTPLDSIQILNYRMQKETLANGPRVWNYEAIIDIPASKFSLRASLPESKDLRGVETTPENIASLQRIGQYIGNIRFTEVEKKSRDVASVLRRNNLSDSSFDLNELNQFGFAQVGEQDDFEFNTMAGELIVTTADGVAVSILIGNLLENPTGTDLTLNYYLMLHAEVDESVFPIPERSLDEGLSEEEADKQNKAYLRKVEQRAEKIKNASLRASALNQTFADWYYVVSEEIVSGLRPELNLAGNKPLESDKTSGNNEPVQSTDGEDQ
jgi:hypothetical protein